MSDVEKSDPEKPKLRPANENPWYCLATLYGEQPEGRTNPDSELAAKNCAAWNRWAIQGFSEDQRAALAKTGFPEQELVPLTSEEKSSFDIVFAARLGRDEELPPDPAEVIDFTATHFDRIILFNHFLFLNKVLFKSASFSNHAGFDWATFSSDADFESATFSNYAGFYSATFSGDANFKSATFSDGAEFKFATFSNYTTFESAAVSDYANFEATVFPGYAGFDSVTFSGDANFKSARFFDALFKSATFSGDALFGSVTFSELANFESATLSGADFESATFSGHATFESATFPGHAGFQSATFSGAALFGSATFSCSVLFNSTKFSGDVDFIDTIFESKSVFAKAHFTDSVPDFRGAQMHDATEWHDVRWPPPPLNKTTAQARVYAYERLKREMEHLKKHEEEYKFFRMELRAKRELALPLSSERFLNYLYEVSSDYGLSIGRPLKWLAVLFMIGASAFYAMQTGAAGPDIEAIPHAAALSLANIIPFVPITHEITTKATVAFSRTEKIVGVVQTLLGAPLLFLLGLALRNRFRMR